MAWEDKKTWGDAIYRNMKTKRCMDKELSVYGSEWKKSMSENFSEKVLSLLWVSIIIVIVAMNI